MNWTTLRCNKCLSFLEIDISELILRPWFNAYLWCEECQGGCDLESWIEWERIDQRIKDDSSSCV